MINQQYLEILKGCSEFEQAVNFALNEHKEYGIVNQNTYQKVCNSFSDAIAKIVANQDIFRNPIMMFVYSVLNDRLCEYRYRTGNHINSCEIMYKLLVKMVGNNLR